MIGKQLADISTRCSSHSQGESESRCQDMHLSTAVHSRIHVTGGWGVDPTSPSPQFLHGGDPAVRHLVASCHPG